MFFAVFPVLLFAVIMRISGIQFLFVLKIWCFLRFVRRYFLQSSCGFGLSNFYSRLQIDVFCTFLDHLFSSNQVDCRYIFCCSRWRIASFCTFFGAYYLESSCGFALYNFCRRWKIDVFYTFLDPRFSSHHADLPCIIFAAVEK